MKKRQLLIIGCIVGCIILLSRCVGDRPEEKSLRGPGYAAVESCQGCHADVYRDYLQTAHFLTSAIADQQSVKGSFNAPNNVFHFPNQVEVRMEEKAGRLFQNIYQAGREKESLPFDISFGSGRKAQTFLYWKNQQYFQLPISYFVPAASWVNSPNFPADHPKIDRVIPSTCFGCHSSQVGMAGVRQEGFEQTELFNHNQIIAGIDCQRCHGPAAAHVNFHTEHPGEKAAHFMQQISALNRTQQVDMCAQCHSGLKPLKKSIFNFQPGDSLNNFRIPIPPMPGKQNEMDVHGNQFQLLQASQCYIASRELTCNSCHDPHKKERDQLTLLANRCLDCHKNEHPAGGNLAGADKNFLVKNCIDCHMPLEASRVITLLESGEEKPTPDYIRTHLIKIYPAASEKILQKLMKQ